MIITSPAFEEGASIPRKFTCKGGNMNPELLIQHVPGGAKSLALILHDPDAPAEGGFTHWVVWNIKPGTTLIKEESVPPGASEGRNDTGENAYFGPCPPSGTHRYYFHLYALDAELDLPDETDGNALKRAMEGHIIEQAELMGLVAVE